MSSINSVCHPVHFTLPGSGSSVSVRPYYDGSQVIDHNGHWHPDIATSHFDVHESEIAYFLEGEFPGVADKHAITLKQVGPQTLMIETKLAKIDIKSEWGLPMPPRCHQAKIGTKYENVESDL